MFPLSFSQETDSANLPVLPLASVVGLIRADDVDKLRSGLESRGVSVEEKDPGDGRTPLLVASDLGRRGAASLLLAHGADHRAEDDEQCNALHLAARLRKRNEMLSLLSLLLLLL